MPRSNSFRWLRVGGRRIEIVAAERAVLAVASNEPAQSCVPIRESVRAAIDERPSLSNEQRRMVEELCGSGRPVDVVIGRAAQARPSRSTRCGKHSKRLATG